MRDLHCLTLDPSPQLSALSTGARGQDSRTGPGRGFLELSRNGAATVVTGCRSNSPLKLLAPRNRGAAAWVFASTYGGGLLAGDAIRLNVQAGDGTTCLLGTQASTKIYRSATGSPARQEIAARVGDGALLMVLPEPVTAFADAVFEQRQRFDVHPAGSLLMLDWLTSGRRARGERWAFSRYQSRNDVHVDGRPIFRDALRLDITDGPIAAPQRMGRFECLGLVVMLGPRVEAAAGALLQFVAQQPIRRDAELIFSASPIPGGTVMRIAATSTERMSTWLREQLGFVEDSVGQNPWARVR